jgi:hypothetical protein
MAKDIIEVKDLNAKKYKRSSMLCSEKKPFSIKI